MDDLRASAATNPMNVLRTRETTESATVSSHPCQKALRYFHRTSQFRVVEASKTQHASEKSANKKPIVTAFAQNGAGARDRSRKLPSKLTGRIFSRFSARGAVSAICYAQKPRFSTATSP